MTDRRPHDFAATLADARRGSTLQLLMRAARVVNEHALARVRAETGEEIRPSHAALFPHIDLEGTNQTELARRVGITKQAVGQLVRDLEALGMVDRRPDPEDGRARLVCWTEAGRARLLDGLRLLGEEEAALAEAVGAERMAALRDALLAVLAAHEVEP